MEIDIMLKDFEILPWEKIEAMFEMSRTEVANDLENNLNDIYYPMRDSNLNETQTRIMIEYWNQEYPDDTTPYENGNTFLILNTADKHQYVYSLLNFLL